MKKIFYICFFCLTLSACQSESNKTVSETDTKPTGQPPVSNQDMSMQEKPLNNPAHGQPYHDCALPVGAPLNAKTAPAPQAAPAGPVRTDIQPLPVSPEKEVKLNPAHGQPGHSCEVPVGSPLS